MLKQKPIKEYKEIAEKCLDYYWNSDATIFHGGGWDKGSPAHKYALRWAKENFKSLKKLQWREIYKQYRQILIQD